MKQVLLSVAALSLVVASASAAPTGISPSHYLNYSCDDLFKEAQQVSARASSISHQTANAEANSPAASTEHAVVVPEPLDSTSPASGELADVKQHMLALEDAVIQKQCAIEFITPADR